MLLIIFYDEFCSFHRQVMPRLESQFNHGARIQFEIRVVDQKLEEEMQCREEASSPGNFARVTKFRKAAKNFAAPVVDFFCTIFDLFQICPC